ncbi:MAG: hypothetical protein JNK74_19835 [Candidatus Hydrogenedentes bacterium]|nr:hypothetical protein [Candidatus Hydrogenedentota bacterium]
MYSACAGATDFAQGSERESWLAHPVYGEASFDAFIHRMGNPIVRGKAPHDWPVNGFLFEDPATKCWYAYVGHYGRNYTADVPMLCTVSRSTDRGATWENLGPIFPDEAHTFEGEQSPEGHAPDVSVVYADGKYHLVYDWLTQSTKWGDIFNPDHTHNSGVGYAWAEKPEGPFHRSTKPVWTTRDQPALEGKYRRQYASTLIRRANDWLVLTLTDSGPNFGWAYLGRTAEAPEGPWSEAVLLLHPEGDRYHPPLLEFHPAFAHDGFLYAPATSVAMNRNVQAVFRAPLESAMDPTAWELHQFGSVWHAEPVENENDGIWGQAFTGFVDRDGNFNVLFPSRDPGGFGTINLASRPWKQPWNEQGFVVSAHRGPSLALLKRAGAPKAMDVALETRGTVRIFWGATMPLGPDEPRSDASLHPLTRTRYQALEVTEGSWRLVSANDTGEIAAVAEGPHADQKEVEVALQWGDGGQLSLQMDGVRTWEGVLPATHGAFGLLLEPDSHARVSKFAIEGDLRPATRRYLWSEGVLSAAQPSSAWEVMKNDSRFLYGVGAVSAAEAVSAKWNVEGTSIALFAPRGPEFGRSTLFIDGQFVAEIDYHAAAPEPSSLQFACINLRDGRHTVRLESLEGRIPVDILEVSGGD